MKLVTIEMVRKSVMKVVVSGDEDKRVKCVMMVKKWESESDVEW